jgi:hypothetical protein
MLFERYYWGEQMKEDGIGTECTTHGCDDKIQYFGRKMLRRRDHLTDNCVGGMIILNGSKNRM